MPKIKKIFARTVLDSRGVPTVETEVLTEDGLFSAVVPSGTSAGKYEALELRDGGKEFFGKGVKKAVSNVNEKIAPKLVGKNPADQESIDGLLVGLDGTDNKSALGANAILSVSMACCRAGAAAQKIFLFEHVQKISGAKKPVLPVPQMVLVSGGAHADKSTDLQEFMIMPVGAKSFGEALRFGAEVYHELESMLKKRGMHTNVGKEGSFAPSVSSNRQALELLVEAIGNAGYSAGKDISIAIDAAASEFFQNGNYVLKSENKKFSGIELVDYYSGLVSSYPIVSLEDGFAEDDFDSFALFTKKLGSKIQVVGDDLLVTNVSRIRKAIEQKACNALLLKPNQIGTVTESIKAFKLAQKSGWNTIVSHRSGDSEDTFIADLAVGLGCGQIKTGAPARSERTAKYNQLLRIEEKVGESSFFRFSKEH